MIQGTALLIRQMLVNVSSVFIAAGLFLLPLYGQTGNISGTITDSSQHVLVRAQVQVQGQRIGASSEDSGKYTVLDVPAGNAKVTVSYLGFKSSALDVTVPAGATAALDFTLGLAEVTSELTVSAATDL